MKAAKLRKSIRSALYPTTQYRPLSLTQLSKPWYYSTSTFPYPKYLSLEWLFPGIFQPSLLQYLSTEWIFTWYFPTTPHPHTVFQLGGGRHISNHVDEKVRLRDCVTGPGPQSQKVATPGLIQRHHDWNPPALPDSSQCSLSQAATHLWHF